MDIPEERKAGFITAMNYLGEHVLKIHKHAKTKQEQAENDEERNIHEGVMVACELIGKIIVNAATGLDIDGEDTQEKSE